MYRMSTRRALTAVVTIAAVGAAAIATNPASGRAARDSGSAATGVVTTARSSVEAAGFATLMQQAPATTLPDRVRNLPDGVEGSWGLDLTETRTVGDSAAPWYVIPGTKGICIYRPSKSTGACATLENAAAGRFAVVAVSRERHAITEAFGLVPDGISAVSTGEDDAIVSHNAYDITDASTSGPAPTIVLHSSSGSTKSVALTQ